MDMYSSGEDLILKTRKPYTITKQREKWTEEEHSRFLEALKLYGRAWQRIEEHIGTKTAVQIRSHAQKFFSKLEKEALIKGVPSGQAHGIEIPPPRPKRKPNNPYPRKTSACVSSSREGKQDRRSASSPVCSEKDLLDMAGSHEKRTGDQTLGRSNAGSDDSKCSVVLSLFQDAPCASVSCAGKHPADAGVKEAKTKAGYSEQHPPPVVGGRGVRDGTDLDIGRFEGLSIDTQIRLAQERSMRPRQPPNLCASPRNGPQGRKSHPDHAPPYSVRGEKSTPGSYATTLTSLSSLAGAHANAAGSPAPAISGTTEHNASASMSSVHHPFAAFPPFAQFGRDSGSSYLNMSSAFSSLIVSTLMQNPAVHAAATVAASFWPTADAEASTGSASESFVGGIPMRQMNPSPSMAAIAAATVAAASAWWATHGLLPFCPPPAAFHGGFAFAPAPTSAIPRTKTAYAAKDDTQRKEEATHSQPWTCPRPVDLRAPAPGQQPSPLSSSDSDESGEAGSSRTTALKAPTVVVNHLNPAPDSREVRESDIGRGQKKADRSSCGSNTPSSSDVETDVVLNLDKAMEEPKETHLGHLPSGGDASNRRLRGGGSVGESWKEVSQEGRLAFQALFSREVLPQSFSPPHPKDGVPDKPEGDAAELTMDLNSKVCAAAGDELAHELGRSCPVPRGGSAPEEGPLTDEIGQGRLKSRRTGFKPYKRCSMEAKDGRATPVEEKDNKRIRLEGEAST